VVSPFRDLLGGSGPCSPLLLTVILVESAWAPWCQASSNAGPSDRRSGSWACSTLRGLHARGAGDGRYQPPRVVARTRG
jgi:hypothetical protein